MPITGIPSIANGDLFSAELWTALKNAIEAKFNGAVSGSDMTNPLKMIGDINTNGHQIFGMPKLQDIYDLSRGSSVQSVFDGINSDGGGTAFIPPDKVVVCNDATVKGANVLILGSGPSSELRLSGAPTRMFTTQGGTGNIWLHNLTLNGNSVAAARGLQFADTDDVVISNCRIIGFTQPAITLTNNGAAGQTCKNVLFFNCRFFGLTGRALEIIDAERVYFSNCYFYDGVGGSFVVNPASTSNLVKDIYLNGCMFRPASAGTEEAVIYKLTAVAGTANHQGFYIDNCQFLGNNSNNKAQVRINDLSKWAITRTKFGQCTTTTPTIRARHSTGGLTSTEMKVNDCEFETLAGDAIVLGHSGTGTGAGATDVMNMIEVKDNSFTTVGTSAGRSLIINKPRYYEVTGNYTRSGSVFTPMEFWGLAAAGAHVLDGIFAHNGYDKATAQLFATSTTGDGGAAAAIGTGANPTAFAIFTSNLASNNNTGISTSHVNPGSTDTSVKAVNNT